VAPEADARPFSELWRRPHLSWTCCDASDVTEVPFASMSSLKSTLG